jgi:hypothetical protein
MNVIYTHRGFPTLIAAVPTLGSVYESPRVSDIYRQRSGQTRPTFDVELAQIAVLSKEWKYTNGFFRAALDPACRIGNNVQSFIAETAMFLMKNITRRRICFQDRALMIKQDSVVQTRLPSFTDIERQAVEELAQYTLEALIQLWVTVAGVDDLSASLELYVGDRTVAPPLQ